MDFDDFCTNLQYLLKLVLEYYLVESIQTKTKIYQKASENNVSGVLNTMVYHELGGIIDANKGSKVTQNLRNFRGTFLKDPRGS